MKITRKNKTTQPQADGTVDEEKKVKHTNMLSSMTNISSLSLTICRQWQANYPQYICPVVDYGTFKQEAEILANYLSSDSTNKTERTDNKTLHRAITESMAKGLVIWKTYVKTDIYLNPSTEASKEYLSIGLIPNKGSNGYISYKFPFDMEEKYKVIGRIINKLQTGAAHHANKEFGLVFWQGIKSNYEQIFRQNEDLRSQRSQLSKIKKLQAEKVKNMLQLLKINIRAYFYGDNVAQTLRAFGFLKENF